MKVITVEGLWTPDDLGTFLGIPVKTLRDWRFKGYGPQWLRLGKHVRYDPETVRQWIDSLNASTEAA
ncbi:helix-turn-helix transcriptional regulator [Amycolatopsis vastitatis]|uniref:helix-turn-helix transcriptional regulator n=1 Tax=Amycolatopsis vastitatis TaxID=1905142 RepID=UPI003F6D03C5